MAAVAAPHRAVVEHLVRQAVYARLGKPLPRIATAPNPLVVNVSARHCHLTQEAVEALRLAGSKMPCRTRVVPREEISYEGF